MSRPDRQRLTSPSLPRHTKFGARLRDLPFGAADEAGLVLCGYIAFLYPPKESAAEAIRVLGAHGVRVKVLTGDNDVVVARKVCRDVGLQVERVLLGREIEAMDDAALAGAVEETTLFAKLSPQQKVRIIQALHAGGCVVGFLGDGINDGPALKAADVGVSVDTAVNIARESADIIMLEKNLLVLDEGVTEGRKVFGNIMKYLKMGSSSNFGDMLSMVGASAFLPFLPPLIVVSQSVSQSAFRIYLSFTEGGEQVPRQNVPIQKRLYRMGHAHKQQPDLTGREGGVDSP